jgi:ABC-type uncharacterized transport system permease subunit
MTELFKHNWYNETASLILTIQMLRFRLFSIGPTLLTISIHSDFEWISDTLSHSNI